MTTRLQVAEFIEGRRAQTIITALIVLNAISLGLETSPKVMGTFGEALSAFDAFVLTVFVVEIAAKLFGRGWGFFRDGWNVFDFVIVGIALLPASGPLAVLRALRVLRVLRLMSVVPQMRTVIQALITAIPGMISIIGLITLIFYVSAVLATNFFGGDFNEWFGSVGASMYSLFQIMTLESWSMGIVRPVMVEYPHAWAFFVPFILVTSFAVINLFIGVIVDAMQTQHTEEAREIEAHFDADAEKLHKEMTRLRAEIAGLRQSLQQSG
ncbi:MAG: voltage-gated sodium channel [Alphaproteobacteria bacterium]|nr:voltage-gated sodium channel [Alphaproteobacteria bacterium]|tara:strand:+ start:2116 stop:2919 length:804 start_codon:yes stop_codon:yes gene_type:complete